MTSPQESINIPELLLGGLPDDDLQAWFDMLKRSRARSVEFGLNAQKFSITRKDAVELVRKEIEARKCVKFPTNGS